MKSSPSIWRYVVNIKSTVKISSIFMAILENMTLNVFCHQFSSLWSCLGKILFFRHSVESHLLSNPWEQNLYKTTRPYKCLFKAFSRPNYVLHWAWLASFGLYLASILFNGIRRKFLTKIGDTAVIR